MPTPKFYLKDNNHDSETPIIMNLKMHGYTKRYSIQKSIHPELWDRVTQRPTKEKSIVKKYGNHIPNLKVILKNIENRIENIRSFTETYLLDLETKNEKLDFDKLKLHLDSRFRDVSNGKKEQFKYTFNSYIDNFINGIENGSIIITSSKNYGQRYSDSSVKSWNEWATQIKLYQDDMGRLNWNHFSLEFYVKYVRYYNDKGYKLNSTGKQIKHLKAIIRRAYNDSIHDNKISDNPNFRILNEEVDSVVLTENEVEELYSMDFEDDELNFYKDLFLIGCYSTLRVSDIKRLKPMHIKDGYIKMKDKKETSKVVIPINTNLNNILSKYNFEIPKFNTNKYNILIKKICKQAGFNEHVEITSTIGGSKSRKEFKKYELIASHSARRTGATNMYLKGIDTLSLMRITGHKKEPTLLRYIKVSQEESAELIRENEFFK